MRISDFKGEAALDFIADIADEIGEIFSDEEFMAAINPKEGKQNLFKAAKIACKAHKAETLSILAALDGRKAEEYDYNPIQIVAQMLVFLKDITADITQGFFFSEQTEIESVSGTATEIIKGGEN